MASGQGEGVKSRSIQTTMVRASTRSSARTRKRALDRPRCSTTSVQSSRSPSRAGLRNAISSATVGGTAPDDYSRAVLADSPRNYWRLGEGSGSTSYDQAGNEDLAQEGSLQEAKVERAKDAQRLDAEAEQARDRLMKRLDKSGRVARRLADRKARQLQPA